MSKPTIKDLQDDDGQLPWHTIPGMYPIVYIDGWDEQLCGKCASKALIEHDSESFKEDLPSDWYIHYEGDSVFCYECNKEIESAYGDPWEGEG
jgi:hypothetical protein